MACYRNLSLSRTAQSQRGRGAGNILRSLYSKVTPVLKSVGTKVINSPITKTALSTVKEIATNASLNVLKDTLRGKDPLKSVQNNASVAKRKISKALLKQLYEQAGKGKRKRLPDSDKRAAKREKFDFVFDDDSVVID